MPLPNDGQSRFEVHPTRIKEAWGHCLSLQAATDASEIFFSFKGGNKLYRTQIPAPGVVEGFFSGAPIHEFAMHMHPITAVTKSDQCALIATGAEDGVMMVWDAMSVANEFSGRNRLTVVAHEDRVSALCFVQQQVWSASTELDKCVRIWRISDGALACEIHTGAVTISALQCGCAGAAVGAPVDLLSAATKVGISTSGALNCRTTKSAAIDATGRAASEASA